MTPNQLVIFLVFCGISLQMVLGQMHVFSGNRDGDEGNSNPTSFNGQRQQQQIVNGGNANVDPDDDDDDDDEDDAMSHLGEVQTLEDFMALLRKPNGEEFTEEDRAIVDLATENRTDGKNVISAFAGRVAVPDNCSPRNVTVRITMEEETDSDTAFFPRCTKVERCGGCCSSPNLECVPRYTERISLKVLKGRVPYHGAPHLQYTGFASVIVDRHVTCRVSCKLNAESCGPLKSFSRRRCTCKCNERLPCPPRTVWDPENCICKCSRVIQCCENSDDCGMAWNPITCTCQLSNEGRVMINADVAQSTTPTTVTTTTEATTTQDPCLRLRCRGRFRPVRRGNSCRCSFRG